jgi:hypothetical protein
VLSLSIGTETEALAFRLEGLRVTVLPIAAAMWNPLSKWFATIRAATRSAQRPAEHIRDGARVNISKRIAMPAAPCLSLLPKYGARFKRVTSAVCIRPVEGLLLGAA